MKSIRKCKLAFIIIFMSLFPAVTYSQMFSVEEPERRARPSSNAVTIGLDFIDMNLRTNDIDIDNSYNFSDPVYRIRLDLPGIEVYAGYRTRLGDAANEADTLDYLNLGANISGAMPITGNRRMGILLPIWLSTDFTQVNSSLGNQPEAEQFRQSSASVGVGAGGFIMLSSRIRIRAEMVPQIGFTVTSLGSDSGQIGSVHGRVRVHMDQMISRFGMVAGYNFSWRRFSGGQEQFHYDMASHSVTIGISF